MKSPDFTPLEPVESIDWNAPHWGEISISATVVYYTPGPYGPIQHTGAKYRYFTRNDLRRAIRNAEDVLRAKGASHIAVDADTRLAFQISGYNAERGSFADVIPREKLEPFLSAAQ